MYLINFPALANNHPSNRGVNKTVLDFVTCSIPAYSVFRGIDHIESKFRPEELKPGYEAHIKHIADKVLGMKLAAFRSECRNMYRYHVPLCTQRGEYLSGSFIAYGGNGGLCISLSGIGCQYLFQQPGAAHKLHAYLELMKGRLSRVDVALDGFQGEFTPVGAYDLYKSEPNQFTAGGRGRKPETVESHSNCKTEIMTGFIVGSKHSAKMLRVYRKGEQIDKYSNSLWCRAEVQFRNRGRFIPLDILVNPDAYFAGAYLYTRSLLNDVMAKQGEAKTTAQRIATRSINEFALIYQSAKRHLKKQYGKLINVMVTMGQSAEDIVNGIIRDGIPGRMKDQYSVLNGVVTAKA